MVEIESLKKKKKTSILIIEEKKKLKKSKKNVKIKMWKCEKMLREGTGKREDLNPRSSKSLVTSQLM